MLFENEQKKYDAIIKAIKKGESKDNLILKVDELVSAFYPFYEGMIFPIDEYNNETHLVRREAFVNSFDGRVNYGYTLYEWRGEYQEPTEKMKELLPELKLKQWCEIFHCTSEKKQKLNQAWVDETLKLLDMLHNKHKTN